MSFKNLVPASLARKGAAAFLRDRYCEHAHIWD